MQNNPAYLRSFYAASIAEFIAATEDTIIAELVRNNQFNLLQTQRDAWLRQIEILKAELAGSTGHIFFEYSIPRMGHRVDAVLLIEGVLFVVEFKVGEHNVRHTDLEQVLDYALDFVNFHVTSRNLLIVPVLVPTEARNKAFKIEFSSDRDKLAFPIGCASNQIGDLIREVSSWQEAESVDAITWYSGTYCPTPTIIEAAMKLYCDHSVLEIARSDSDAVNLSVTTAKIDQIIEESRIRGYKSICFVTGVPGAGKTLVGLNVATTHLDQKSEQYSVFLSGNGPLVAFLREALTRDRLEREKKSGKRVRKGDISNEVKAFIQNVHHFRDACLMDQNPPVEHVALFDEAQRAWKKEQTSNFMKRKKGVADFDKSEPDFLISCLDRWQDWAVIVCLVGGGQEINTGEAGISEWFKAIQENYPRWRVHVSDHLSDSEYRMEIDLDELAKSVHLEYSEGLHLKVSLRSFRAELVSQFVKALLDIEIEAARQTLAQISDKYPIVLTRDKRKAIDWLKRQARGSERYGIVVSSQAERLKPLAINVKAEVNPIHWFLNDRSDVRSSYYLEDVATEFHIQGLELDWVCVTWDADLRFKDNAWDHWSFKGHKWMRIKIDTRQKYQINAYRVLLTRARQGMVICVPEGDKDDHTRKPEYYDPIYNYLLSIGLAEI